MLRLSRSISLAIAAGLAALAVYFLLQAEGALPLVRDEAGLLSDVERRRIAAHHAYLIADHDIDYRVVTAQAVADIDREAVALFEDMASEERSRSGRGLLLVIDSGADLVRLEVGYALESVFPDAFAAYVEHRQMVPFFERGRVAEGILATTELLVARAQEAAEQAAHSEGPPLKGSGGAGATVSARLGAGSSQIAARAASSPAASPGASPAETLMAYIASMEARNADPDLAIYTPATRKMLRGWVMTPAQMDNVARAYRTCPDGTTLVSPDGRRAVIRFPIEARACPPYFFAAGEEGWALDLVAMQRTIGFGRSNAWRLLAGRNGPFAFAFADWRFDGKGFPQSTR